MGVWARGPQFGASERGWGCSEASKCGFGVSGLTLWRLSARGRLPEKAEPESEPERGGEG